MIPRNPPSVDRIIERWRECAWELPELKAHWIGWGEPFCFACGWLPPIADGRRTSWQYAARWLDRAHLHDHCFGGTDEPANLVMLCHLCHDAMPSFVDRVPALAWVTNVRPAEMWWQFYTDANLRGHYPSRSTLVRARRVALEVVAA